MPDLLITITALEDGLPLGRPVVECLDAEVVFDQVRDETLGALLRSLAAQSILDSPRPHFRGGCDR